MYKFKIKGAANDQYRVQFLYNLEIMVWSENLTTKQSTHTNIASVKNNASTAPIVDLTIGENSQGYRWEIDKSINNQYYTRFIAPNGETVVRSECYTQKHNAINCVKSVSNNASDAQVIDETVTRAA